MGCHSFKDKHENNTMYFLRMQENSQVEKNKYVFLTQTWTPLIDSAVFSLLNFFVVFYKQPYQTRGYSISQALFFISF